jgi:hypothetical protein
MPNLSFKGSIIQNIYNGQTIGQNNPIIDLTFPSQPVNWDPSNIPPSPVNTYTLEQLVNNPLFSLTYTLDIIITGSQSYNNQSTPSTAVLWYIGNVPYNKTYQLTEGTDYNVNDTKNQIPGIPRTLSVSVYNQCAYGLPGCLTYPATNYRFTMILNITATANCTGSNLSTAFCSAYCLTNSEACLQNHIDYCFSDQMPIGSNLECQNFIKDYIVKNGPRSEFDNGLLRYCSNKYNNFGDLFSASQTDQDLCACHMPAPLYTTYADELNKKYEGFENIFIKQCLLPGCINSPYKSETTTAICPLPACLNIVEFENNGTFVNSCVDINQSGCTNIKPKDGGSICGNYNLTWLWILLAIIAIIVVFIIMFALIVKYKHHKRESLINISQT